MESNDSSEIPDGGGDIRHPRPPFGGVQDKLRYLTHTHLIQLVQDKLRYLPDTHNWLTMYRTPGTSRTEQTQIPDSHA